jgi:undecaprenyl-diphosphatase
VVFFGVLTYFAWTHWRSLRMQIATAWLYGAVVAVVGFDRIFLNVHWLSDVIGAIFLGAFWVSACILLFKQTCHFIYAKSR